MAESDDEYDRKRRDKFRGERSSGDSYRSDRRDDRRREEWSERNPFRSGGRARPDYRDYRGPRDKYSPGRELPPAKRMRPDWGEDIRPNPRYGGYDPYMLHNWGHDHYANHNMHAYHLPSNVHREFPTSNSDVQTQPAMLTLKQFLDTQEDTISDSDVLRKYSEYKLDFKRQQLNEFFVTHKDEEWFKNKYHPSESVKRKLEQKGFLKRRADVFNELLENGTLATVTLDSFQGEKLLRLLDTVVIKLEGGTDEDLKVLDEEPQEVKFPEKHTINKPDNDVIITEVKPRAEYSSPKRVSPRRDTPANDDEENWDEDEPEEPTVSESKFKTDKESKKRSRSDSSDSSSSASGEENDDPVYTKPDSSTADKDPEIKDDCDSADEQEKEKEPQSPKKDPDNDEKEEKEKEDEETASPDRSKKNIFFDETTKNDAESESEDKDGHKVAKIDETNEAEKIEIDDNTETIDVDKEKSTPQLQALHRTSSIFLRNLAPTITKAEIEAICQRFAGYLRVAIADPLAERRWFRRGWVTFKRDVNIKEICWNLNNTRLRDCEIGAIVNRDLSRRVRPINGITAHKTIVRSDIKLCAKIALNLDEKFNLWDDFQIKESENPNGNDSYGFKSNNPVMQNITDFLIEEASAEEDELLGISADNKDSADGENVERDPQIITVLDKMILYLRIVHSVDFYNHCEYPYEDEMPNRCGIIHTRGPAPQNKVSCNDIQDYIKNFENKMQAFLTKPIPVEEDELKNLGLKDPESEVEKFVQANTQELAKDKWLCPLSGKKFKGPEFIRKHIFNKHGDKVDEVRKEVEYFNNYLKDPKRPQLPEHSGNARRTNSESGGGAPAGYRPGGYMAAAYAPPYNSYAPPMMIAPRGGGRGFGGGRRELPLDHQRRVIGYHDLDAPTNFDIFD